jgi:hypothetical protein
MGGACSAYGDRRSLYGVLIRKLERRPFGRPRCRWEVDINLQEPCVLYIGRAHLYPPNTSFYIFIQQISVLNILNMLHTLSLFLFKMPVIS